MNVYHGVFAKQRDPMIPKEFYLMACIVMLQ